MCGIAGILRLHRPNKPIRPPLESIPEKWLDILDDSIQHRGPDGAGRFRDRATRPDGAVVDVAFVHRRLSIIDHAGGWQPMVHVRHTDGSGELLKPDSFRAPRASEGTGQMHERTPRLREGLGIATIDATQLPPHTDLVAVVFNGCLYNHRELRVELEAFGHRFETDHSDTEVLIHGWRRWGPAMQDRLDGMYAFLLWERRTARAAWGRDLAGEKPLYRAFTELPAQVLSSTPPGPCRLIALTTPGKLLPAHVDVRYGCRTHGRAVASVAPGTIETAAATAPDSRHIAPPGRGHQAESAGTLDRLIHQAIGSRLEADVPLGVFLSGGLDSALIAAIAHKSCPDIRAFTVRMPHPDYDESEQAAATAAAIGIEHTILDCRPDPASDLLHLIEQLGLPFGDSSLLPTYWVSRAAREHIKVALSGDGGDELFGGYRRHTINPTLNRWRHLLRLIPDRLLDQRNPKSRSTYLARLAVAARHGGYDELLSIFPSSDLRRLIPARDARPAGDGSFHPGDDPLLHDFEHYLPDDLLRKTDTASMAVGLEVRAPFLARELVDAAMRTPLSVLMPGNERKGLLKQVARKCLPPEIVDRPKQGFAIPIGEWFRTDFGSMRQLLYDHLESADPFPGLAEAGININMHFVRRMLGEHDAAGAKSLNPWHGRDHSQRLYMLLVLSIWTRWLERMRREGAHHSPT